MIPFNKPYFSGKELDFIRQAVERGQISGNGFFTKKCQQFFEERYKFKKCLLTSSCTDALEMTAILCEIQPGDEVIVPAFTFVSSANAFVLRGAKIVFVDSRSDHPGLDENQLESLINKKTKAIVVVHYGGVSCDMDKIMTIANRHGLFVVEDAAQSIDSFYHGRPLGSIGHFGTFSFHETKNVIAGEGGMLVINDERFEKRAEIIWEKGTNRTAFFRGDVDKYGWVDVGSSFLPSDVTAAFLWAQLEELDPIQKRRLEIWNRYWNGLEILQQRKLIRLPSIPDYGHNNAHMFYILLPDLDTRSRLITGLREQGIQAVFHYLSLSNSPYIKTMNTAFEPPNSAFYSDVLLRLPFYYELTDADQQHVINEILAFFR